MGVPSSSAHFLLEMVWIFVNFPAPTAMVTPTKLYIVGKPLRRGIQQYIFIPNIGLLSIIDTKQTTGLTWEANDWIQTNIVHNNNDNDVWYDFMVWL